MSEFLPPPATVAVALNLPLPDPFTYLLPDDFPGGAPAVGNLVEVPFGQRKEIGCVVPSPAPGVEGATFRLRPVARRASPGFSIPGEIVDLARWISEYYFCGWGEALATASMIGFTDTVIAARAGYALSPGWKEADLTTRQAQAAAVLAAAGEREPASLAELARVADASPAIIRKLADAGALIEGEIGEAPHIPPSTDAPPELLPDQRTAIDAIEETRRAGKFGAFLLYGVTGSGKTEVYLRLIANVLAEGRTAICLVPEIALTPQTVDRFARRFQQEIGVFHSQLTRRDKLVLHGKIRDGRIRLVIGARSAAFAPLPNLGLIVIDEEHETSYKQSDSPRYHARDVSIVRASRLGIPIVLGSATPSLESWENARRGKYRLLRLSSRPAGLSMPEVRIVAMGKAAAEDASGISLLSNELRAAIADRLARGEQTLLFLNRRGFSNFLMCPSCRWVARCPDDDVVLTIHRSRARRGGTEPSDGGELELFPGPLKASEAFLKCHFCGTKSDYPAKCPNCEDAELMAMGSGTQRIEECIGRVFPEARLLRLDQDAVGGRQAFLAAWQRMVSGEAQIILGTQMIAKGLHLERVTLVGVILAEVGLFIPDFRAEERTLCLLTQVAGRSGRVSMGEVILQTYMPQQPAIVFAAAHNYEGFVEAEMQRRHKSRFPPVERLIALTLAGEDFDRTVSQARNLTGILRRIAQKSDWRSCRVLGPLPAPIERLAGRYRQRILLRGPVASTNAGLLRAALADSQWKASASVALSIDVDPMDLL